MIIIQKIRRRLEEQIIWPIAIKYAKIAALYYLLFTRTFDRECRSVLAGKVHYYKLNKKLEFNPYQLRRNTHRLEKALVMRPRKAVFALDYIEETVNNYVFLVTNKENSSKYSSLVKWSNDVLYEYFNCINTQDNPRLLALSKNFERNTVKSDGPYYKPKNVQKGLSSLTYEDFYNLSIQRRSVRWFIQEPVDRKLILKAVSAATFSPSACNRQPFTLRIIDEKEMIQKVARIPLGTSGFYENIPVLAVLVGQLNAYYSEQDKHVIYIDSSLFAMSFMYACETLGLSTCPINWPDIAKLEDLLRAEIQLEVHERPVMMMAIGYADKEGMTPYSGKKTGLEIVKFNG